MTQREINCECGHLTLLIALITLFTNSFYIMLTGDYSNDSLYYISISLGIILTIMLIVMFA